MAHSSQHIVPAVSRFDARDDMNTVPNPRPSLPIEIWALALGHLADSNFPEIWAACSLASHTLREAVELVIRSEILRNLDMTLSLIGCIGYNRQEFARLQFKGLSKDNQRVHYGEPDDHRRLNFENGHAIQIPGSSHGKRLQGNLPILIEWTDKLYMSVCRGPTSYHKWSEQDKQNLRQIWLRPNSDDSLQMVVHHTRPFEVSFLWQPLLKAFLRKSRPIRKMDTGLEGSR
ncbi:hypothetical protein E8E14_009154 [Neopestalotiopsis sp. 37M]|nr:hypothetical protein E8E14_009154 [Neopestalotiopsis sp. 37M]